MDPEVSESNSLSTTAAKNQDNNTEAGQSEDTSNDVVKDGRMAGHKDTGDDESKESPAVSPTLKSPRRTPRTKDKNFSAKSQKERDPHSVTQDTNEIEPVELVEVVKHETKSPENVDTPETNDRNSARTRTGFEQPNKGEIQEELDREIENESPQARSRSLSRNSVIIDAGNKDKVEELSETPREAELSETPREAESDRRDVTEDTDETNNNAKRQLRSIAALKNRNSYTQPVADSSTEESLPRASGNDPLSKKQSFTGKLTFGQNDNSSPTDGSDEGTSEDNINVIVRVRPLNEKETDRKDTSSIEFPGDGAIWIENFPGSKKSFTFNVVFEYESRQDDIFQHSGIKKLIDMSVAGYSCTTFAYGQTGSGKTHTITGPPDAFLDGNSHEEFYGLIPRSFHYLFESMKTSNEATYTVHASYLEIYNEQVIDLLNPNQGRRLDVRWSKDKGFHVENLFDVECESADDLLAVLEEGLRNRQTSSHSLNENSSRSHSLLSVMVDSEIADPDDENLYITKHGKLTFVDLAGSEKVKDSGSTGEQLLESNNINRSLLVLGNCISSLGDAKKKQGHIPYRDSKLTKLLADSLGGSGVTLMIACVNPSFYNLSETINTLRYANRAKRIRNKPVVKMDPRENFLRSLKREVKLLTTENQYLRTQMHFPEKSKTSKSEGKIGEPNKMSHNKGANDQSDAPPTLPRQNQLKTKASHPNGVPPVPLPPPGAMSDGDLYTMLQEYMVENETLRHENSDLHFGRDTIRREHQLVSRDNDRLQRKLEDLTRIMSRSPSIYSFRSSATSQRSWDLYSYDSTPRGTPPHSYPASLYSGPYSPRAQHWNNRQYSGDSYGKPAQELPPVEHRGGGGGGYQSSPTGPINGRRLKPPPHPGGIKPPHRLADPVPQKQQPQGYKDKYNQKLEHKSSQEPPVRKNRLVPNLAEGKRQDQQNGGHIQAPLKAEPRPRHVTQHVAPPADSFDDMNERLRHELSDLDSQIRTQHKLAQQTTKPVAANAGNKR